MAVLIKGAKSEMLLAPLKEDNLRLQKDNEETKRQLALIMSRLGM